MINGDGFLTSRESSLARGIREGEAGEVGLTSSGDGGDRGMGVKTKSEKKKTGDDSERGKRKPFRGIREFFRLRRWLFC